MPKGFPKNKNPELYGSGGPEPTTPPPAELPTLAPEGGPKGSAKKGGITEADAQALMAAFYGLISWVLRTPRPGTKEINEDAAWLYRVITRWPAISVVVIAGAPLALAVRVVTRISDMVKKRAQQPAEQDAAQAAAEQQAALYADPPAPAGVVDSMPETAPPENPVLQQAAALAGSSYRSRGGLR